MTRADKESERRKEPTGGDGVAERNTSDRGGAERAAGEAEGRAESPSVADSERGTATREFNPGLSMNDHPFAVQAEPALGPNGITEGSRFGAYRVGPCIGQGGMARIYRAEHTGLRRLVALKVLTSGVSKDIEGRERFLREARIAAAIKHPNVVNIFDVGVCQGIPYLVMELLEGQDLESFVEANGPLDEATIIDLIVPVVAGLVAVHDSGVVHRDLKPGNIFLARGRNDEIEPKLLDFGISKSLGGDQLQLTSANGQIMGTPFYMPPEAVRGVPMSPLSDQYALGVVLYECATGRNPFQGSTFPEVISLITHGKYTPLSQAATGVSRRFVSIAERAMALDPKGRFSDIRELGRELLLLAGQRTRITWGLTFGEPGAAGAKINALAKVGQPGGAPSLPVTVTTAASRRTVNAGKIAAGAAGLLLLSGVVTFAAIMSQPPVGEMPSLPTRQDVHSVLPMQDLQPTAQVATNPAAVTGVSLGLPSGERPLPRVGGLTKGRPKPRGKVAGRPGPKTRGAAARGALTQSDSPEWAAVDQQGGSTSTPVQRPEWAPDTVGSPARADGAESSGSNGSPILD